MLERHNQLVQLIAKFWDIERDSDGVYLPGLTEEQLVSSAGGRQVSRTRRVRLADVVATGILNVCDVLVWKRSGKGEEYRVAVVAGGDLQLPDGSVFSSPSAASVAVGGTSTHALDSWKRESDG